MLYIYIYIYIYIKLMWVNAETDQCHANFLTMNAECIPVSTTLWRKRTVHRIRRRPPEIKWNAPWRTRRRPGALDSLTARLSCPSRGSWSSVICVYIMLYIYIYIYIYIYSIMIMICTRETQNNVNHHLCHDTPLGSKDIRVHPVWYSTRNTKFTYLPTSRRLAGKNTNLQYL
jgi:hypothetical protein